MRSQKIKYPYISEQLEVQTFPALLLIKTIAGGTIQDTMVRIHAAHHYGECVEALVISDNPTVVSVYKTYKLGKGRVVRITLKPVVY